MTFYCALLHYIFQILHFSQIEVLWQPCIKQVNWSHFFPTALAQSMSLYHILVILKIFHYYYVCYGDLGSLMFDVTIVIVFEHQKPCP